MYFPSFGQGEKVADCKKGIIVNSYKLPFSSSHFFFLDQINIWKVFLLGYTKSLFGWKEKNVGEQKMLGGQKRSVEIQNVKKNRLVDRKIDV